MPGRGPPTRLHTSFVRDSAIPWGGHRLDGFKSVENDRGYREASGTRDVLRTVVIMFRMDLIGAAVRRRVRAWSLDPAGRDSLRSLTVMSWRRSCGQDAKTSEKRLERRGSRRAVSHSIVRAVEARKGSGLPR